MRDLLSKHTAAKSEVLADTEQEENLLPMSENLSASSQSLVVSTVDAYVTPGGSADIWTESRSAENQVNPEDVALATRNQLRRFGIDLTTASDQATGSVPYS